LKRFEKVKAENIEVTDDVIVIEALGLPVKLKQYQAHHTNDL